MKTPALREVRLRLEEAIAAQPGDNTSKRDQMDHATGLAIAVLDSEHADFPPELLQRYLTIWLELQQMELGIDLDAEP